MSDKLQKYLSARIENYRKRFDNPSPDTLARWKRQIVRQLDAKNQLALPLEFPDEPMQQSLFNDLED